MLCTKGHANFTINSRNFRLEKEHMAFLVFDMVTVLTDVSTDFEAMFLTADYDASQNTFFIVPSNRFWEFVYACPVFRLDRNLCEVTGKWFDVIKWISAHSSAATSDKAMRNEIENFMAIMAEQVESNLGKLGINPIKNRAWTLVNEFMGLLKRYSTRRHNVAFYAAKLNITPNYLNIIVRKSTGSTAKEQINLQNSLITKMLLHTTDLTVKEIAERLHYADPSYLCRIFRKQTGMSPMKYRNNIRKDN